MDDAEKAPKPLSAEEFEVLNVDVECCLGRVVKLGGRTDGYIGEIVKAYKKQDWRDHWSSVQLASFVALWDLCTPHSSCCKWPRQNEYIEMERVI